MGTLGDRHISWQSIAIGVLVPLCFAMAPSAIRGYVGSQQVAPPAPAPTPVIAYATTDDVKAVERRVVVLEAAISEQSFQYREIKGALDRQSRLLMLLAQRQGIAVAQ